MTYAVHVQLPQAGNETAEQTEVHLPGDWIRHRHWRASATWEQWEVRLAAEIEEQRAARLQQLIAIPLPSRQ